jgi:hypothetical protein
MVSSQSKEETVSIINERLALAEDKLKSNFT